MIDRDLFLLDPDIVFLNHGSFGAAPRPVFDVYQAWQERLERQPVLFLARELSALQLRARQALGEFIGADADDLVYIPNATYGVNLVARSLDLKPGDEILTTDHEYGACDNAWEFICQKAGAHYRHQPITLPVTSPRQMVEQLWAGVTPRTRLIFFSHITSPTALCFPAEVICKRARRSGIMTLVDGAHAPGQIPLDMAAIGADFYTGNMHKWALAPKGAAFLYTRRERQPLIEPLVVSWGWGENPDKTSGSRYVDYLQWTGTYDPAAALAVPAAIRFLHDYDWPAVGQGCHVLLRQALRRIADLTGIESVYAYGDTLYHQMAIAPLPAIADRELLKTRLYDEYAVEVPLVDWNGRQFVRISVQGYNSQRDIDVLLQALETLLPQSLRK